MKEKDEQGNTALAAPSKALKDDSIGKATEPDVNNVTGEDDAEQIRAKIDDTRSEMGDTLGEIQERLSVANISEQVSEQVNSAIESVKTTAYDATIGKAVNFMKVAENELRRTSVGRTVMNNPIPFALIGAGTAMLLLRLKDRDKSEDFGRHGDRRSLSNGKGRRSSIGSGGGNGEGVVDKAKHAYENAADTAKETYDGVYDSVSGAASTAYDSVAGVAESTYSGAAGLVSKAKDSVGDLGHKAQDSYEYYAEEKPLALAAAAVAVGAAIGFAIPSSRYESKMMGETRDNLWHKAEGAAGELVDQVKETATNAGKAATDELGLSGESGLQSRAASSTSGQTTGQTGQKASQRNSTPPAKGQSNR